MSAQPCEEVELPHVEPTSDIRFLDEAELIALLEAIDIDERPFGHTDGAMFLTAALTGLRQGESRHGLRSVPLSAQVAAALKRHFARSRHRDHDDLAFGHPNQKCSTSQPSAGGSRRR